MELHQDFSSGFPYRLRGMATDPKYQNQGMGALLLQEGILHLKSIHCDLLWFNARLRAFAFYEKLGFHYHGKIFHMDKIGPHKVMYKHLIPR
jgi:GNAT superfamily N-acetyltransferase